MLDISTGLLPQNTAHQLEPANITESMEHLESLIPELAHLDSHNLQTYALAYVEHFQGDVLHLELEWDFLSIALFDAWQHENFEVVMRLAAALAYPASRHGIFAQARRILQLGIAASRKIQDRERLASFLSRLGSLLFMQGKYQQGWRLWHTALQFTDSLAGLWEPCSSFVQIADILGNTPAVQQFFETIQARGGITHPDSLAVALFIRGFHARWQCDLESACADLSNCLHLLNSQTSDRLLSPSHQLFGIAIQTELARAQGYYARAQMYTETTLSLAQTFSDPYTVATLLIDQAVFAERQGQLADLNAAYQRLCKVAPLTSTPHILACRRRFEQYLEGQNYSYQEAQSSPPPIPSPVATRPCNPLSERETEVLRLVAAGLSNQEIAARLVVTTGTIKKHLEHIYTRLDVHNRTAALVHAREMGII